MGVGLGVQGFRVRFGVWVSGCLGSKVEGFRALRIQDIGFRV